MIATTTMRAAFSAALVLTLYGAAGCSDRAERPLRIRVVDNVNVDIRDVPLLIAFDQLTAQGYQIERTSVAGNQLLADVLARGEAEIGIINNQTAWTAVASGADIRTVAEFTAYTGLIAARSDVRSCGDLRATTVALPGTAGFAPLLYELLVRKRCPDTRPETIVIAESTSRAAALLSGRVGATMMPGEELLKLQAQSPRDFHAFAAAAVDYPGVRVDGIQVRRAWAEEHRAAVEDLIAAQLTAHRLVRARPEMLYNEASRRLSLDLATATTVGRSHLAMDLWDVNGGLTRENIESTVAFLVESGGLPSRLAVEEVADLSYLDAVLGRIGRGEPRTPVINDPYAEP